MASNSVGSPLKQQQQQQHLTVGVMAIQGAFLEHQISLQKAVKQLPEPLRLTIREIRHADDITNDMQGLIIPGGESTTMSLFLRRNRMEQPLKEWIEQESHVTWGTCAGMILLSKETEHQKIGGQSSLGITDTLISRNYFGGQVESFEADIPITHPQLLQKPAATSKEYFRGVFIRAPAVLKVNSPSVEVLASLRMSEKVDPVVIAFQQGRILGTAFHPELTEDMRWHKYFLLMLLERTSEKSN